MKKKIGVTDLLFASASNQHIGILTLSLMEILTKMPVEFFLFQEFFSIFDIVKIKKIVKQGY